MKLPVIIDCDPGVDDALAIILALNHRDIDVKAVCSVTGNGNLENTTKNAKNIVTLCGRKDIPVYKGSATALDKEQPETVAAFGDDGLGGYAKEIESDKQIEEENAVDFLVRAVREAPGELTIVAIGPCTNIALAVRKDPHFAENVKQIIIMGGSKYTGNMSPVAEYNFWADPRAAKEVMEAGFKRAVMIGLDVTNKIALDAGTRELMRIFNTPLSRFLYDITKSGLDKNWEVRRRPVSPMHDVLTIAYLIDPSILKCIDSYITVVTEGEAKGQSLVDLHGHWQKGYCNAEYAAEVDVNKFYHLFMTTVFADYKDELEEYFAKNRFW